MKEQDIINYYFENAKNDLFGINLEEVLSESDFIEALQALASLTEEQINEVAEAVTKDYERYIYSESSEYFEHPFSFIFEAEAVMAGGADKGNLGKAPGTTMAKKVGYETGKALEKAKGFFGKLKEKAGELLKSMGNAISKGWEKIKSLPANIAKASSTAKKDFMIGFEKGLKAGKAPAIAAKEAAASVGVQIDEKQAGSIANSVLQEISAGQEATPVAGDTKEAGTSALIAKTKNPKTYFEIGRYIKANYDDIRQEATKSLTKLKPFMTAMGITKNYMLYAIPLMGFIKYATK